MGVFGNNNLNNGSTDQLLRQLASQFIFGRVLSIDQSSRVNSNGSISVEIMKVKASPEASQVVSAQPLFPNIKSYPLTNEVVFLITGPKSKYSQNTGNTTYYYFSPLKMWGNVNTNPTPNPYTNTSTISTQKYKSDRSRFTQSNLSSTSKPILNLVLILKKKVIYSLYIHMKEM
jgi:hypothetical protein